MCKVPAAVSAGGFWGTTEKAVVFFFYRVVDVCRIEQLVLWELITGRARLKSSLNPTKHSLKPSLKAVAKYCLVYFSVTKGSVEPWRCSCHTGNEMSSFHIISINCNTWIIMLLFCSYGFYEKDFSAILSVLVLFPFCNSTGKWQLAALNNFTLSFASCSFDKICVGGQMRMCFTPTTYWLNLLLKFIL